MLKLRNPLLLICVLMSCAPIASPLDRETKIQSDNYIRLAVRADPSRSTAFVVPETDRTYLVGLSFPADGLAGLTETVTGSSSKELSIQCTSKVTHMENQGTRTDPHFKIVSFSDILVEYGTAFQRKENGHQYVDAVYRIYIPRTFSQKDLYAVSVQCPSLGLSGAIATQLKP